MSEARKPSSPPFLHKHTQRSFRALALSLCLMACSGGDGNGGDGGGGDMIGGSSDMGTGGGDMGTGGGGSELALLAGQLGGIGFADRTGPDARLYDARYITADGAGNLYVGDRTSISRLCQIVAATGEVSTLKRGGLLPQDLAVDGASNLYFISTFVTSSIQQFSLSTGSVTTVAGGGSTGGADGTGAAAQFDSPQALAWDGAGNLYAADRNNHTIRKVIVATGQVTTLAGTAGMSGSTDATGAAARFNLPAGVAVDTAGNVYVADTGNHTIRQIVAATGVVTTIAGMAGMSGDVNGTGSMARFQSPAHLATDGAGNVYLSGRSTVRKIVVATGVVTTIAGVAGMVGTADGTGAAARLQDSGDIAWGGSGSLYVTGTTTIRKVVAATGEVTTLAGKSASFGNADGIGAAASFRQLEGNPAVDDAGNVYVHELSSRIRKIVLATGEVTTLRDGAGQVLSLSGYGLAHDGAGNLYVADSSVIRKVALSTNQVTILAGAPSMSGSADGIGMAARFGSLGSLTWDGAGNLYAPDRINSTIRKIVAATGEVTTLAGTAGMTGTADGVGAAARFSGPQDVVSDRSGTLFIADTGNFAIRKIVVATAEVTTLVTPTGLGSAIPSSLAWNGAGNLYVATLGTFSEGVVRKVVVATGQTSVALGELGQMGVLLGPLPGGLSSPRGLVWVPNQGLVLTEYYENAVLIARGL